MYFVNKYSYVGIVIGSCNPNPCLNGGTCVESSEMEFSCRCQQNANGRFCENGLAGELVKFSFFVRPAIF